MEIRMIRSEEDLTRAIRAIADLMERAPAPDSEDFERLEVLCVLVQNYEQRHHPVPPPSPLGALRFHMERLGWTQAELAERAGVHASHLSAVLRGRRALSLSQIKKLSRTLDISPALLIDTQEGARVTTA